MKITITGERLKVKRDIRDLIKIKINRELDKYLHHLQNDEKKAVVTIKKEDYYFKASFDMWLPSKVQIYAEEEGKELVTVLYSLRDEVERQLIRYQEKGA